MKGTPLDPPRDRSLLRRMASAPGALLLTAGYLASLIRVPGLRRR